MYEQKRWSIGPFFEYWNIDRSKVKLETISGTTYGFFEPHNQTIEYGLQARYRF